MLLANRVINKAMTNEDRTGFVTRLEMGMSALNINQRQLAEEIGVSSQIVSQIKTGLMKGNKHIPAIARVLEAEVEWLKNGTGEFPSWATDFEDFKKRLNVALGQRGKTAAHIATALRISQAEALDVVRGSMPARKELQRLADLLDVSYNWLAHGGVPIPIWVDYEEEIKENVGLRVAAATGRGYQASDQPLVEMLIGTNKNLSDQIRDQNKELSLLREQLNALQSEVDAMRADTKSGVGAANADVERTA